MRASGIALSLALALAATAVQAQAPKHALAMSVYESDGALLRLSHHAITVRPAPGGAAAHYGSLGAPADCSQGRIRCADIGAPLAVDRVSIDSGATYALNGYRYMPQCLHPGRKGHCKVAMVRFHKTEGASHDGYFVFEAGMGVVAISDPAHDPLGKDNLWTHRSGAHILGPGWSAPKPRSRQGY